MISRDLTLNVGYSSASLNQPLFLYRYDRNIMLNIEVKGYDFMFGTTEDDLIGQSNIVKAKSYLKSPKGEIFTYPMVETEISDNKVKILINNLMTDESSEVGEYKVQIQLFDEDGSTITLHPFEFTVLELIATTEDYEFDSGENSDIHYDEGYTSAENVITSNYLNKLEDKLSYLYSKDFLTDKEFSEYKTGNLTTVGAINELLDNYNELNAYYNYLLENRGNYVSYDEYRTLSLNYDSNGEVSLSSDYSSYVTDVYIINKEYGSHIPVGGYYLFRWNSIPEKYKFNVRWKSDNPNIARVNSSGKVIGVSPGTARITMYFKYNESVYDYVDVIVGDYKPITSITVSPVNLKLDTDDMGSVTYKVKPADTTQSSIDWYSEGDLCVNVEHVPDENKFVLRGISDGTCNLVVYSVENDSKKAICKVTVGDGQYIDDGKNITILETSKYELEVGESLNLQCQVIPNNLEVNWKSSNPGVITIDSNGKITAVNAGFSEITASIKGYEKVFNTMTFAVRNSNPESFDPNNPDNYYVIIDSTSLTVNVGESFIIGATTNPKDATISWGIEDDSIVSYKESTYTKNDLYNKSIIECTAKTLGTTRVYCNLIGDDGNEYKDCNFIKVIEEKDTLIIKNAPTFVDKNQSVQLECVTYPSDLSKNVRWKVSNGDIASITQQGLFTVTGEGFVEVTCYVKDKPEISDKVTICVGDISPIGGRVYIDRHDIPKPPKVGNYFTVKAGTLPQGVNITWSIDNPDVASLSTANADLIPGVYAHPLLASLVLKEKGIVNLTCSFIHEDTGEVISDNVELNIQYNSNPNYIITGKELIRCYEKGNFGIKSPDVHNSLYTLECISSDEDVISINSVSNSKVEYTANNVGTARIIFTFNSPGDVVTVIEREIEVCPLMPESVFIVDPGEIDGTLNTFQLNYKYDPVDEPNLNRNTYSEKWILSTVDAEDISTTINNSGLLTLNDGEGIFNVWLATTIYDKIDNRYYEYYTNLDINIVQAMIVLKMIDNYVYIPTLYYVLEGDTTTRQARRREYPDDKIIKYSMKKNTVGLSFDNSEDLTFIDSIYYFNNLGSSDGRDVSEVLRFDFNRLKNLKSIHGLFSRFSNLTRIEGIENWNTSNIVNVDGMFNECSSLTSINLSNWNTSNIKSFIHMFDACNSLRSIGNTRNWDTKNIITMGYMFRGCKSLTSLDSILYSWDVSNVKDMCLMFRGCSGLTSLYALYNWNTSNVEDMYHMFEGCSGITTLYPLINWNTSNVIDMTNMFSGCSLLTEINSLCWDISNVKSISNMFSGCSTLDTLDLSGWSFPSNVIATFSLCENCINLKYVNIPNLFYPLYPYENGNEFKGCTSLNTAIFNEWTPVYEYDYTGDYTGDSLERLFKNLYINNIVNLDLSGWKIRTYNDDNKSDYSELLINSFKDFKLMNIVNISGWDTIDISSTEGMFYGCKSLENIIINESWNISNVKDMSYMFYGCSSLVEISAPNLLIGAENLMYTISMFEGCTSLEKLDLTDFYTGTNLKSLKCMFKNCCSLEAIEGIKNWTMSIPDLTSLFEECHRLTSVPTSSWEVYQLKHIDRICYNCSKLTSFYFPKTSSLADCNMDRFIYGCDSLTTLRFSNVRLASGTLSIASRSLLRHIYFESCSWDFAKSVALLMPQRNPDEKGTFAIFSGINYVNTCYSTIYGQCEAKDWIFRVDGQIQNNKYV